VLVNAQDPDFTGDAGFGFTVAAMFDSLHDEFSNEYALLRGINRGGNSTSLLPSDGS
jgi:hypothetical protein